MARINISQILMKRGNTAAAGNYIGPLGELVVDTGLKTVRIQDGVTAGGMAVLATLSGYNQLSGNIANLQTTTANISANLSAFQTYANTTFGTNNFGNANVAAYLTTNPQGGQYSNANVASYLTTSNIITGIDANVTAANLQIANLWSNAGVQADAIAGANAAIITANTALKGYVDTQLSTLTNGASTALDTLLEIGTALGNNANFSATMITWLGNVTANTTAANTAIDTLQANLGGYYTWANANVAGLYGSITAANTAWQANAGVQADAIVSLTANAGVQADAITSLQANITAANLAIAAASGTYSNTNVAAYLSASTTSNVGAGNLTVVNNFSTNVISANSFTYANGTSILAGIGGTYTDSNVASYLPTYTGDIAGNIVKNGHTWTFGNTGTTTFPSNTIDAGTQKIDIKSSDYAELWFSGADGTWQSNPNSAQNAYVYADLGGAGIQTVRGNDGNAGPTWNHTWRFGNDGGLQLPLGGAIAEGGGLTGAIRLTPAGGANSNQALLIYPTAAADGDHVHLTAGGGTTELYLGDDNHYVKLASNGDVRIQAVNGVNGAAWGFGTDGTLTLPGNLVIAGNTSVFGSYTALIQPTNNLPIATISSGTAGGINSVWVEDLGDIANSNIAAIYTPLAGTGTVRVAAGSNATSVNLWDFNPDGNLTLPETGYLRVGTGIVAGFASSPAPIISGFSSISAENFKFQGNGVNILSTVAGTYSNTNVEAYIGANIGTLYSNAATQATSINAITANIGSFYTYANLNYGTSSYANANVIANLQNFVTSISTSANIATTANVIAPRYLFANGVNILSTITAVANLSNLTGNIGWTAVGATPPTFTTASNGTKIVLWPSISSTMVDYAIGIEAGNTWFSIPQATNNFGYKWYAGNTAIATLSGNGTLTTGNITTTGNVSATNFVGNGAGLTNVTVSAAGNIVGTSSNVTLVAGNYSYTFDNTGNVTLPANVFVGVTNTFLPNTVASFSANVNYYSQVTLQNKNSGNDATADYIVTANNGSDTVNFLDLGIINSGYDNTTPSNSLGNIVFAADSYIYAQGNTSNANQSGGNLAIGTATTGKTIKFFAGGTTSSAIAMTVANTGVTVGGNLSVSGNIVSTGQNVSLVAGNFTAKFDNTGILTLPAMGGDEGGEINFGIPATNTTLNTRVVVDVYQDRLRIFDGNTKGAYIDLSQASSGVGTLLNNRVSGLVNAGTFVTMDLIKATVTTSGQRGLSLATTTGTFAINIGGTYATTTPSSGGSAGTMTVTTTASSSIFNWSFPNQGDMSTYILTDTTNSRAYRITLQIGASYNNNMISIERLI